MKRFNVQNDGNLTKDYPLFFGKPLGLFDIANEPYPEIEKLDDDQQALFWKAGEIDLTQDAVDIMNLDENVRDLIVENLGFQMAADSFANGMISDLFSPVLSNNAATSLISYWSFTESVHAKAYARIISEAFKDTNELLERVKGSEVMLSRLNVIMDVFKEHKIMLAEFEKGGYELRGDYFRKTMLKTLTALIALEGIMFLGSFASSFAVCEATQKLQGIGSLVGLIHDDEAVSHRNNGLGLIKILRDKEKYPEWDETVPEMKEILDTVVGQELAWAEHLFTKCKPLIGFNAALLQEHTLHISKIIYDIIEIPFDFRIVSSSPFSGWMSRYTQADMIQVAQQEQEGANYLTSTSLDDTASVDEFDF